MTSCLLVFKGTIYPEKIHQFIGFCYFIIIQFKKFVSLLTVGRTHPMKQSQPLPVERLQTATETDTLTIAATADNPEDTQRCQDNEQHRNDTNGFKAI